MDTDLCTQLQCFYVGMKWWWTLRFIRNILQIFRSLGSNGVVGQSDGWWSPFVANLLVCGCDDAPLLSGQPVNLDSRRQSGSQCNAVITPDFAGSRQ